MWHEIVEIKGIGEFKIKHNYLHRGNNPRLMTFEKNKYKWLQFDSYNPTYKEEIWQKGYDLELNNIELRIISKN